MGRPPGTDDELDALIDKRDHVAIQISLLNDAENQDPRRLELLRREHMALERLITNYRPSDA